MVYEDLERDVNIVLNKPMNEETEIRKTKVKTNEKEYEGNVKLIYVLITKEIFIR